MPKLDDNMGPFVFPVETQLYWTRLEGMGLRESFEAQLHVHMETLKQAILQGLTDISWKPGDLNVTYHFKDDSQIDEFDIEGAMTTVRAEREAGTEKEG